MVKKGPPQLAIPLLLFGSTMSMRLQTGENVVEFAQNELKTQIEINLGFPIDKLVLEPERTFFTAVEGQTVYLYNCETPATLRELMERLANDSPNLPMETKATFEFVERWQSMREREKEKAGKKPERPLNYWDFAFSRLDSPIKMIEVSQLPVGSPA